MATAAQNAAQLAEVKRKASLGIALTNSTNASNNALYDQTRAATEAEIKRKAANGISLTNTNSAANNSMYDSLVAAKNSQQPVISTPNNSVSPSGYIDGLAEAKRNQTLAALEKSRNAGLSNLGSEKTAIQPKYYDAKNQTAAGSQQQARNFAEFMAARGGTGAGSNAQAELTRGMTLQGNLGSLGRQEAADYSDIERRTSDLQNAYQSDVASATAGMEAERMSAMLNDYYQQQQRELQIAELTGMLGNQQTLGGKSLNQNILDSNRNYQLNSDNQQFNQNLATNQFNEGVRQYDTSLQYTQGRDATADAQWQKEFDRILKQDGVQNALSWASHNLNVSQENRISANQSSSGSGNGGSNSSKPSTESTIQDINRPRTAAAMETYIINNLPGGKNIAGPPSPNQLTQIESMILDNPNLSEADMVKLYNKFGIPLPS
ncbi:hypothetical protein BK133_00770 [Paenibacillus sp. FSL H8-0548]|uniref:hypothetical protein n=1 Tax=Paenibacillus sp. FSL H8-0548 TaxID=1920422 RepID=UPI00096D19CF|nr:hypothetical protein [Paenibacillus sp. FSL H8-0548]OMF38769.1 hypothetical protein BK133_00770 [Paenibacillus sp. FSL H8-0548]